MGERDNDKKQVYNLCKKALLLNDDDFKIWKEEINRINDPVVNNLYKFLESKRGAL